MRNSIKKNNSNNKYNDIKTKLETNLENDINVHKWLIKFFNENKNKDESLDNIENKSQKKEKKELIVNDEGVIYIKTYLIKIQNF